MHIAITVYHLHDLFFIVGHLLPTPRTYSTFGRLDYYSRGPYRYRLFSIKVITEQRFMQSHRELTISFYLGCCCLKYPFFHMSKCIGENTVVTCFDQLLSWLQNKLWLFFLFCLWVRVCFRCWFFGFGYILLYKSWLCGISPFMSVFYIGCYFSLFFVVLLMLLCVAERLSSTRSKGGVIPCSRP
jgi:hypothetical protein